MARENRRKREERRFGRPDRLVDIILAPDVDLGQPIWLSRDPDVAEMAGHSLDVFRVALVGCPVVVMDNVAEYYYSFCEKSRWDCEHDFPGCRPPFDRFFLEARRPSIFRDESGVAPFDPWFPSHWGFLVESLPAGGLERRTGVASIDELLVPMLDLPGVTRIVRSTMAQVQHGSLLCGAVSFFLPIDDLGCVLDNHKALFPGDSGEGDSGRARAVVNGLGQFHHTALLAMSFMNCKNVTLEAHERDPLVNRERRRHGRKPFLRYHTINIEPMKAVLRTEGNVESEGLRRALHICRGHFATYTADKPLFGRTVGTVWRPSHVRGHASEGVVVSDYNVDPTKN
jgi:hypothetical protein